MTKGIDLHADELRKVIISRRIPKGASAEDRISAGTEQQGDCLVWVGSSDSSGYGTMFFQTRTIQPHRAAWALRHGFLSKDVLVIHTCENPLCCNPDHMFTGQQPDIAKYLVSVNRAYWQVDPSTQQEKGIKYGFPKGRKPTHGFGSPLRNRNPSA